MVIFFHIRNLVKICNRRQWGWRWQVIHWFWLWINHFLSTFWLRINPFLNIFWNRGSKLMKRRSMKSFIPSSWCWKMFQRYRLILDPSTRISTWQRLLLHALCIKKNGEKKNREKEWREKKRVTNSGTVPFQVGLWIIILMRRGSKLYEIEKKGARKRNRGWEEKKNRGKNEKKNRGRKRIS